jgi:hypothetical protein
MQISLEMFVILAKARVYKGVDNRKSFVCKNTSLLLKDSFQEIQIILIMKAGMHIWKC